MKNLIFSVAILISFSACNQSTEQAKSKPADTVSKAKKGIQYTCPMDPEVVTNKPGICPKCGMDLVEKQAK